MSDGILTVIVKAGPQFEAMLRAGKVAPLRKAVERCVRSDRRMAEDLVLSVPPLELNESNIFVLEESLTSVNPMKTVSLVAVTEVKQ